MGRGRSRCVCVWGGGGYALKDRLSRVDEMRRFTLSSAGETLIHQWLDIGDPFTAIGSY